MGDAPNVRGGARVRRCDRGRRTKRTGCRLRIDARADLQPSRDRRKSGGTGRSVGYVRPDGHAADSEMADFHRFRRSFLDLPRLVGSVARRSRLGGAGQNSARRVDGLFALVPQGAEAAGRERNKADVDRAGGGWPVPAASGRPRRPGGKPVNPQGGTGNRDSGRRSVACSADDRATPAARLIRPYFGGGGFRRLEGEEVGHPRRGRVRL
ncbi:hypothetical protein D3C76_1120860 [compost metagenome]